MTDQDFKDIRIHARQQMVFFMMYQDNRGANNLMHKVNVLFISDCQFHNIDGGIFQSMQAHFDVICRNSEFYRLKHTLFNLSENSYLLLSVKSSIFSNLKVEYRGTVVFVQNSKIYLLVQQNCEFFENLSGSNGSIFYFHNIQVNNIKQKIIIEDSIFEGNASYGSGGVFYMELAVFQQNTRDFQEVDLIINNCEFIENYSDLNGGVFFFQEIYPFDLQIKNCNIIGNKAKLNGGFLYADTYLTRYFNITDNNGENSQIFANIANQGGALYLKNIQILNILYNKFVENQAISKGAAIFYLQGINEIKTDIISNYYTYQNHIDDNLFQGNTVEFGQGGVLYFTNLPSERLYKNIVLNLKREEGTMKNNIFENQLAGSGAIIKVDGLYEDGVAENFKESIEKTNPQDFAKNNNKQYIVKYLEEENQYSYMNNNEDLAVVIGCQFGEYYSEKDSQCYTCLTGQYNFDGIQNSKDYDQFSTRCKKQ